MKLADLDKHGFNWNSILDFCRKNIRYISAGIIVVILVIVLAVTASNQGKEDKGSKEEDGITQEHGQEEQSGDQSEAFAVDAVPEVNILIKNYYSAYVAGDLATIETYATPISDTEKSYINLMSQYYASYENVKCYTKKGLNADEYAVSVVMDVRFEGIETLAPGLDFFYVRKNESGVYYIDNLYSQFNLSNTEQELDSQVQAYIAEYETQDDVLKLVSDVQSRFDAALASDEALHTLVNTTIPQAFETWAAELANGDPNAGTQPSDGTQPADPAQDNPPAEGTDTNPVQAVSETVYATSNVNIRQQANEASEKVGSAVAGQSFTRTGITADGWSEIDYNGTKAYVKSEFLSTQAPEQTGNNGGVNYVPEGTVLTANKAYNVRKGMGETSDLVGTVEIGESVKVVLSYQEGWTKVEWKGKTGYIRTDLLLNN